ncbi:MAG: FAD:protein FMN transferase [Acidimicrobiia bacterium]
MSSTLEIAETRALGTTARIVVDGGSSRDALSLMAEELEQFEQACSRFRPDSDLSRVNDLSGRAVRVDPVLLEAVEIALRAARITGGRVDPTIGKALRLLGYDRDFATMDKDRPGFVVQAQRGPGWECVEVDRTRCTIRVPKGVQLDLGATAKGFAADRVARHTSAALGCGVLVSLGGDIAIEGPAPTAGWSVRVTDDHAASDEAPGQTVSLRSGGLATSSTTVRRWSQGGAVRHHVLDPTTGLPTSGPFRTVSVTAATCVDANTASTAALVLGDAAPPWLAARHLPARLTYHDGRVLCLAGWPEPEPEQ